MTIHEDAIENLRHCVSLYGTARTGKRNSVYDDVWKQSGQGGVYHYERDHL